MISMHLFQVLASIPEGCCIAEEVYVFRVPVNVSLGIDEADFSNVAVTVVSSKDCQPLQTPPRVAYFASGKLGVLKGGLSNVFDYRERLSNSEINVHAEGTVQEKLADKRTALLLLAC